VLPGSDMKDIEKYEACAEETDNQHTHTIEKEGQDVLRIPRLEVVDGQVLECDFNLLAEKLSSDEIEEIIVIALLKEFCMDYYKDKALYLQFKNLETNEQWRTVNIY
jgi:hypothetical protein